MHKSVNIIVFYILHVSNFANIDSSFSFINKDLFLLIDDLGFGCGRLGCD